MRLRVVAVLFVVCPVAAAHGVPPLVSGMVLGTIRPPSAEEILDAATLPRDADSLIAMLESGIPAGFRPNGPSAEHFTQFPEHRFLFYEYMIVTLGNLKSPDAEHVLRSIESGDLASVIWADLDRFVSRMTNLESWIDWNIAIESNLDALSLESSLALYRITNTSPVPRLLELLRKWTPLMVQSFEADAKYVAHFAIYNKICTQLTMWGHADGIDGALTVMQTPRWPDFMPIPDLLRKLTGQWFGPYTDTPPGVRISDVRAWSAWWEVNRGRFLRPTDDGSVPLPGRPFPKPESIRDYIWISEAGENREHWEDSQAAGTWLAENARSHMDELYRIVRDTRERTGIRAKALQYCVDYHQSGAYSLIVEALKEPAHCRLLHSTAISLARRHFPKQYIPLLVQCVEEDWGGKLFARASLSETAEGRAYLRSRDQASRTSPTGGS